MNMQLLVLQAVMFVFVFYFYWLIRERISWVQAQVYDEGNRNRNELEKLGRLLDEKWSHQKWLSVEQYPYAEEVK